MPYYKGVHFDQAFHTEEDLLTHNGATLSGEPVVSMPAPSEPDFAVSVPDRATPIVEVAPVIDAEADPFPSFVPEKDPETQPEPVSEQPVDDVTENVTPADTPDAKKKKSGRSRG